MVTVKGVWVWNNIPYYFSSSSTTINVNFTSNGVSYSYLRLEQGDDAKGNAPLVDFASWIFYGSTTAYSGSSSTQTWANEAYKTIDFGDTEQEVSDEFYTWFTANATQQATEEEEPTTNGVTVEYNGSVVATIPNGNTATLPIADKKMKTDIVITVPEAESGTDSALPIEVSTEEEMTTLFESGEVGGVYKYTGTTGTYENGALYVLWEQTVTMYAPTVASTSSDGELEITDNSSNVSNTVKYGIYEADGTLVEYVDKTGSPQIVYLDMGVQYYATAVSADGTESPASNLATTKQCFVAGTPILMADGSYKMIEEIAVGDKVQSYNLETSEYCEGEVTEVVTGYTDRIAMVLFSDSNYIAMAEGHPLYTEDGWHSITNKDGYPTLVVGDKVLCASGYVEIVDIQVADTEPTMVYSLAVSTLQEQESSQSATAEVASNGGIYFAGAGVAVTHV